MEYLIAVLKASSEKHGSDTPLTIGHLLNIALLADKIKNNHETTIEEADSKIREEAFNDSHKYGN